MRANLFRGLVSSVLIFSCSASLDDFNRCHVFAEKYCESQFDTDQGDCVKAIQTSCQDGDPDFEEVNNCIDTIGELQKERGATCVELIYRLDESDPTAMYDYDLESKISSCRYLGESFSYAFAYPVCDPNAPDGTGGFPGFDGGSTGGSESDGGSQSTGGRGLVGTGGRSGSGGFGGGAGTGGSSSGNTEVCRVNYSLEGEFRYDSDYGDTYSSTLSGNLELAITVDEDQNPVPGGAVELRDLTLRSDSYVSIYWPEDENGEVSVYDDFYLGASSSMFTCGGAEGTLDGENVVSWAPCEGGGLPFPSSGGPGCIPGLSTQGEVDCYDCNSSYAGFFQPMWPQMLSNLQLGLDEVYTVDDTYLPQRPFTQTSFTFSGYAESVECGYEPLCSSDP